MLTPKERICTFPPMGRKNSLVIKSFLESLDLEVVMPPKMTSETVKKGVKNCASMICYPLKTTMGAYIEALDLGANTLLAYDTRGQCRYRQYPFLHSFALTGLGYDFDMPILNPKNIVGELKKISGKSRLTILKNMYKHYKMIEENDKQTWSEDKPNIGLIGEIYVMNNEEVNLGLEEKVRGYDCNLFNTATTVNFMKEKIPIFNPLKLFKKDPMKDYKKKAKGFLNGPVGGHAEENLYNLLDLVDRGVEGAIHIAPMTCTAENCIEPYVNHICKENKIPLLRIPIDENSAERNLETRLEVFTEMIKMRKGK